ncbi:hypothetical protein CDD82_6731 [Ophiocordyceps australis]|uniref:Peptidase S8/S53 domain-containing protein n=1 Tax=Ophiocordyceps australis TaxID=1399860 RepID=A0A2C5YUA6_9HYPO|nr:hypothetical protein CDD82_6731 [Ophiocordyceps australis]
MAPSVLASLLYMLPLVAAVPTSRMSKRLVSILSNADAQDIIPNKFIAVYNNSFSDAEIEACQQAFTLKIKKRNLYKRSVDGEPLATEVSTYKMDGWRAMAFDGDEDMVAEMNDADEVNYIEADHWLMASDLDETTRGNNSDIIAQPKAPSSLKRISHAKGDTGDFLFDAAAGSDTTVYIVDTGIRTTHEQFEDRAIMGASFVKGADTDDNGHGSHVAGTVGGRDVGVAKNAQLVGVKVLNAKGAGANSAILSGLQWVLQDSQNRSTAANGRQKRANEKFIMNMSLGGSFSQALNSAMTKLSSAGVVPVVAAGNEHQPASNVSPASADGVICVGAMDDTNDRVAKFSNFGPEVDVFAPGVNILSVDAKSDTGLKKLNGTSMASPATAGVVATLMQSQDLSTVEEVKAQLKKNAEKTGAQVKAAPKGTTTDILNNGITA